MVKELGVDYMSNCVFINESGFNANLRRTQGWASKGEAVKVKVLTARANSISTLAATSAKGLISGLLSYMGIPSVLFQVFELSYIHI